MKKILLISNKVFHYRVSNYNYFSRRFEEEGYEFIVRASSLQKNNPYRIDFDFEVIPFGFFAYKAEVERIAPSVVILFLHLKDLIILPLIYWLKAKGIHVVYWNKGINLEVASPRWRNYVFYHVHTMCDAIILYSRHNLTDIQEKNRSKVFVANNTINLDAIPTVAESKESIKSEFSIPYAKVVLYVGRMRSGKRVEDLIEAFNGITDPDIGCVLVGDSMAYNIPALVKGSNVMYLGELFDPENSKMSKLFKAADIFCIPGDVGLGVNEAFYWGLPVVTEDVLQGPEIHYVRSGRNGFIVGEGDVDALREKLLTLLYDDSLRAAFSLAAREDITRDGSIETMFRGFRACVKRPTTHGSVLPQMGTGK